MAAHPDFGGASGPVDVHLNFVGSGQVPPSPADPELPLVLPLSLAMVLPLELPPPELPLASVAPELLELPAGTLDPLLDPEALPLGAPGPGAPELDAEPPEGGSLVLAPQLATARMPGRRKMRAQESMKDVL